MNRNFKVVFSKARGALMVVNEATASVQAKGTKTVITAAIAAVAGAAVAAESAYVEAPTTAGDNVAIFNTTTTADKLKAETSFVLKTDTKTPLLSLAADTTLTGKLWVTGDHANARASGVWLANKDATVTNEGTIYVTSTSNGKSWQNRAMGVDKGTLVNNGTIVAKDAYGLTVGSSGGDDTAKIINGVNGKIIVEDRGVGIELGGIGSSTQTKAEATNYGTISVGAAKEFEDKATKGQFAIGVQIKGDSASNKLSNQKFTNEGTIDAAADGAKAVYVQFANGAAVTNNGTIKGLVHVDAHAENTKLTFGEKSVLTGDINVDGTNTEIGFAQDAVTTGNLVNTGTGTKIQAAADKKVATLTGDLLVKKGDVTQSGNLKANNLVVGVADATANGQTVAGTSGAYTVKGTLGVKTVSLVKGSVTVDGTDAALTADEVSVVKGTSVVLSNKGAATAGKLTVAKDGTVTVGKDSVFTVTGEGANAGTIAGVAATNQTSASVGTLKVAGALANTGTISTDVEVSGTLNNQVVSGETKANGKLSGAKLTIAKGGVVNTLVTEKTYAVQNTVVEAGGVFNVLELNSKSNDELKANDCMLLAGATLTLDGGAIQVAGKDYTDGVLKLGTKEVGGSLVVRANGQEYWYLKFTSTSPEHTRRT